MKRAGPVIVAVVLAGCDSDLPPVDRVVDFRLLAVAADRPFARPGDTVHLTTLAHEPFGRPTSWAWTTCPLPDDTTVNACLAELGTLAERGTPPKITSAVGQDVFDVTIPTTILDAVPPAARSNALLGVVTVACPGDIVVHDFIRVKRGELPFSCRESGTGVELARERWVVAVKRIYLHPSDRNDNPVLSEVSWDGAPWPADESRVTTACDFDSNSYGDCKGETHQIAVKAPPGTKQSGTSEYGTPFDEAVIVQYYATEGTFEYATKTLDAPGTGWAARLRARGRTVTMWFVLRDDRGGVTWTSRRVEVR